jgi:phage I-like protein
MTAADRFTFFADAPDVSAFNWPDGAPEDIPSEVKPPTNRVQVAKVGRFKHPTYGGFAVTRDTFDAFVRNFDAGYPTDRLPVDFDHKPDKGGPSAACGWISKLEPDGDSLFATVEWTWEGAYALREQTYRYVSPTWQMNSVDEAGEKRGPTLLAFALTNRPYFQMPAVSLSQTFSQADLELAVEDTSPEPEPSSDSRRRMTDFLNKIAAVFSLGEDATEDQVLTAAHAALAARVPDGHIAITAARVTDLEAAAKVPPGHTVIASNVLEGVEQKAASADRYKEELAEIKFVVTAARGDAARPHGDSPDGVDSTVTRSTARSSATCATTTSPTTSTRSSRVIAQEGNV